MPELARLLDPTELDSVDGPHGKMAITLSSTQLGEPVEILVPSRLACARCDGGGCDSCGRSGAVRLELEEAERTTHVILPSDAREQLRVRLVRPLGDDAGLEQLTLEVRVTPAPVTAMTVVRTGAGSSVDLRSILIAAAIALAAAIAIAAGLR